MKKDFSAFAYIQEQSSFAEDYDGNFGYEVHDRGNRFFLTFNAILQSFGVRNRNRRKYMAENVMNCIHTDPYIQDQLRLNKWMGEMDHPTPTRVGEELTVNRICTPDMERTTHYIRSPRLEGNLLKAHIQTDSSNKHGMNMAIKIVDGKIVPGFSARVMGEMRNMNGEPTVFVKKLITYDFVGFQSHPEALAEINQPLQESVAKNVIQNELHDRVIFLDELAKMVANNNEETQLLCEAFDLSIDDVVGITENGSVVIQENQNVYVQPITDKRIRAKTTSMLTDWLTA